MQFQLSGIQGLLVFWITVAPFIPQIPGEPPPRAPP